MSGVTNSRFSDAKLLSSFNVMSPEPSTYMEIGLKDGGRAICEGIPVGTRTTRIYMNNASATTLSGRIVFSSSKVTPPPKCFVQDKTDNTKLTLVQVKFEDQKSMRTMLQNFEDGLMRNIARKTLIEKLVRETPVSVAAEKLTIPSKLLQDMKVVGRCNAGDQMKPVESLDKLLKMGLPNSCSALRVEAKIADITIVAGLMAADESPLAKELGFANDPTRPDIVANIDGFKITLMDIDIVQTEEGPRVNFNPNNL